MKNSQYTTDATLLNGERVFEKERERERKPTFQQTKFAQIIKNGVKSPTEKKPDLNS